MPDYTLGRIERPDDRDRLFPMSMGLGPVTVPPKRKMWRGPVARLNQGGVGACVGFAGAAWLGTLPIYNRVTNQTGLDLYHECKKIDEWPNQEGSHSRYLAKVLVAQGRIERYLWAQSTFELEAWVKTMGSVMVGIPWFADMFDPDANGRLHVGGQIVGGHEVLVRGCGDEDDEGYRIRNSWGRNWGDHGEAWISKDDLHNLIFQQGGDAFAAEEIRPV